MGPARVAQASRQSDVELTLAPAPLVAGLKAHWVDAVRALLVMSSPSAPWLHRAADHVAAQGAATVVELLVHRVCEEEPGLGAFL